MVYVDESRINEKISSSYIIQRESKVIKKFLEIYTCSTVYMEKLQSIQNSFSYSLSQNQSSKI